MASLTVPTQASELRIGGYICLEERPYKVVDMTTSSTGKHGGSKIHFIGVDIFTEKKKEHLIMSTDNIDVPYVVREDYQLVDIDEDDISYLDKKGNIHTDLRMPDLCDSDHELAEIIRNKYDEGVELIITVLKSMDITAVKGFKVNTK